MRSDFIGLVRLMYASLYFKFNVSTSFGSGRINITLSKLYLRSFLSWLRYGSLSFGAAFSDMTAVEVVTPLKDEIREKVLVCVFFLTK